LALAGVPLVIDGSYGEGGAALVRTALAMASLTQQPTRIVNIRADAKRTGLSTEDVAILRGLTLSCGADVIGGEVGEKSISFIPTRRPRGLNEKIDVPEEDDGPGHANANVVCNALMPVMARTGAYSTLVVKGETYGNNVLSYDYFGNVTLAALRRFGLYAFVDQAAAGFGRGSRGELSLDIEPSVIQGANWARRGELLAIRAVVATAELPEPVGQRGVAHLARLGYYANLTVEAEAVSLRARAPGAFATVWAEFENGIGGATAMGARGVRMESIAQVAFENFLEWYKTDATVDPFLADQLLLPAVLAEGETVFKVSKLTARFLTVVWVIKQFLPIHITVKGHEGEPGTVTIRR
jgi:RNA 3'-terminal phosphate cyclase (ATP)